VYGRRGGIWQAGQWPRLSGKRLLGTYPLIAEPMMESTKKRGE
jgi:hypothetical protein